MITSEVLYLMAGWVIGLIIYPYISNWHYNKYPHKYLYGAPSSAKRRIWKKK